MTSGLLVPPASAVLRFNLLPAAYCITEWLPTRLRSLWALPYVHQEAAAISSLSALLLRRNSLSAFVEPENLAGPFRLLLMEPASFDQMIFQLGIVAHRQMLQRNLDPQCFARCQEISSSVNLIELLRRTPGVDFPHSARKSIKGSTQGVSKTLYEEGAALILGLTKAHGHALYGRLALRLPRRLYRAAIELEEAPRAAVHNWLDSALDAQAEWRWL